VAVELDRLGVFGTHDFPRGTEAHPVVGQFDLVTVAELLAEQTELIVDAVADGGVIERGERIEKTGGETTETAVAEAHVVFLPAQLRHIEAEFLECFLGLLINASVVKAVGKKTAHEEFQGKIIDPTDILLIMDRLRGDHPLDDPFLNGLGSRQPPVALRGGVDIVGETEFQLMQNRFLHRLRGLLEETVKMRVCGHGRMDGW